ncbi:ryanodine receptor 2-like [Neolamprologus brichardi]|uniref:ryanodine receptor 2-like n=1 Tax=Neolamprologus brichardi TaxID=32507 RepID=UPI001643F848|nr:ryanodine receptor 2-like [Neolamprologus brichardi]
MAYADIMAKSCHDEEDDDGEVKSFEEKEMEKQKLLYQQARLHDRGAAEMVLQTISASKGEMGPMVASTLKLGIAILNGGNSTVQQKMLDYLKDKKDVGFFQSLAGLMQSCSARQLVQMGVDTIEQVDNGILRYEAALVSKLKRILMWPHNRSELVKNESFQGLHDESISDFYWYYSGKDVIDEQGQRNFSKAINVAKQVFNTLTEYIQK